MHRFRVFHTNGDTTEVEAEGVERSGQDVRAYDRTGHTVVVDGSKCRWPRVQVDFWERV